MDWLSGAHSDRLEHAELLIMSTYLVAQLLLVLGVIDAPDPSTRTDPSTVGTDGADRPTAQPAR